MHRASALHFSNVKQGILLHFSNTKTSHLVHFSNYLETSLYQTKKVGLMYFAMACGFHRILMKIR